MNKYLELKKKHEEKVNEFPMGFAFNNKQFEEAKEKLGVKSNDELLSITGGGFIRKTDRDDFTALFLEMNKESEEAMKDDDYLFQGFLYELGNHEYCITYESEATLNCFSLTIDEVEENQRLKSIWLKARDKYLNTCEY